ncbi:MAG: serine hydrolase [Isosphaeraceae bacterium]|nr:serine hydrolase [Isosphaeraceae bacterium]
MLVLLALLPTRIGAQETIGPRGPYVPVAEALERFLTREVEAKGLPALSIALVDDQEIVWARGFGFSDPERTVPATAETVYRVGSISKLFTDIAALQLVERGVLDLDAPIRRYLPDFQPENPTGRPITLRQLMAHHSGLVREPPVGHYFDPTSPSLAETVQSLNRTRLVVEPGWRPKYSNAALAVVGYLLEKTQGEPFALIIERAVLAPMGLKSSGFALTPDLEQRLAVGWMWTYQGRTFPAPTFPLGTAPAGNLYATVNDLGRFLAVLFAGGRGPGGQVIKPETVRGMMEPQFTRPHRGQTSGFGLGFRIEDRNGQKWVRHSGAIYGFAAELVALPAEKLGVVVAATKDGANGVTRHAADLALRLLRTAKKGDPLPRIEPTEPIAPEVARRIEGRHAGAGFAFDLEARGGRLYLTPYGVGYRLELRRWGNALIPDDVLAFGGIALQVEGDRVVLDEERLEHHPFGKPEPVPERWAGLIGEYGWDHNILYILERGGRLYALIEWFEFTPLREVSRDVFLFPISQGLYQGERLVFRRDANGRATQVEAAGIVFPRRPLPGEEGSTFRVEPTRPVADLRAEALAATPPSERGEFRTPELVELTQLDPSIKLDIRYATANNFLGTPFYATARAFLQRPAAEALVRAHRRLKERGYGLLIHDAYRPWYVTKMFWDGTPESAHRFVADPAKGSRHNRGCAVDLTLYDLPTGRAVAMVGGYDEFSDRSSPDYPGGTSLQRWHRDLLRRTLEDEGFTVNAVEWWHFDYKDWNQYSILNQPLEEIEAPR